MNIKHAAERAGVRPKTIRYYEEIGLLAPQRLPNGYRDFAECDVLKLSLLKNARSLGFPMETCRALMSACDEGTSLGDMDRLVFHDVLKQVDAKIRSLHMMHGALEDLVKRCAGNNRPDCPILEGLAEK